MSAAAPYVETRPKLTAAEVVALQGELARAKITPERRSAIRQTLKLARDREEVARSYGREWDQLVSNLCRDVLVEDENRVSQERARASEEARRARLEERRQHIAGRPARFAALPAMDQALLVAESRATTAPAGFKALREALAAQVAGAPLDVPWTFETELLPLGKLRALERSGAIDPAVLEQAEQRERRENFGI